MNYVCKIDKNDKFNIDSSNVIILEDDSMFRYTFWEQSYKNVTGKLLIYYIYLYLYFM